MSTVRIRWCEQGEFRLGRLALGTDSSGSIPLSSVSHEISQLVLGSVIVGFATCVQGPDFNFPRQAGFPASSGEVEELGVGVHGPGK